MARHQSREFKVKDTDLKVEEEDNNTQNNNSAAQPDPLIPIETESGIVIKESLNTLTHNTQNNRLDQAGQTHASADESLSDDLFNEQEAWGMHEEFKASSQFSSDQIGQAVNLVIRKLNLHKGSRKAYQESMAKITGQMSKTLSASGLFSSVHKSSSGKAKGNSSSASRLVLYYATAQAMVTMMLGFKHIFRMLDTPSDAGNKALSISYAAVGLLGIHLIMLVALAKHFF